MADDDTSPEPIDPREAAEEAGLRYVTDDGPGITRRRVGKGFSYRQPGGGRLTDKAALARIRALAIPPAYTQVWICPHPDGHIQATGRDARGRKQYRYHPRWREVRDAAKYDHMLEFAKALPVIRARIGEDMGRPGLKREKVLATVVHLLETTLIRVGNDDYAKQNESFGLTTLQDDHVQVAGTELRFSFKGKSGKTWNLGVRDRRVARIVRACQDLPGQELFQYLDEDGAVRDVTSADVNEYLRQISGRPITAKDFRTWAGTVLAALALREFERFDTKAAAKKNVKQAIERVASRLGNTPTICRKCYVHPAILDGYLEENLVLELEEEARAELAADLSDLKPEEAAVLALLLTRLQAMEHAKPKRPARRAAPRAANDAARPRASA
jgi:DNA topoisomerase-1